MRVSENHLSSQARALCSNWPPTVYCRGGMIEQQSDDSHTGHLATTPGSRSGQVASLYSLQEIH